MRFKPYRPTDSDFKRLRKQIWNALVHLDRKANHLLGGCPTETISCRAGKAQIKNERWACILCKFLDIFDRDHCAKNVDPH